MQNPVLYDHLQFFNNGVNGNVVPNVNFGPNTTTTQPLSTISSATVDGETGSRDYIRVVEFIKHVPVETKVSSVDLSKALGIDIMRDRVLVEMLKSNPKLESGKDNDGSIFFRYRAKLIIRNKLELKQSLARSDVGILMSDIEDSYSGIRSDIMDMIRGGEIIGVENKEKKTLVLFSRGSQYFSTLSGTASSNPGEQMIETTEDVTNEVRRGEAVLVGQFWYRVSSAVKIGAGQEQPQRARAPASVTMDKDLSDRNEYILPFTKSSLPLDGDFEDPNPYSGPILKHGATNDVRQLWRDTAVDIEKFRNDEMQLVDELFKQKHIFYDRQGLINARSGRDNNNRGRGKGRRGGGGRGSSKFMVGSGSNPHLQGSGIERIVREVEREQIARQQQRK